MDSLEQVSLSRKFLGGELQFGFWGGISRCLGLVNSFIIIHALSVHQYGTFQLLLSAYAFLTNFISWGGFGTGTDMLLLIGKKREAESKKLFLEYNVFRLISAILLWLLFFIGAPLFSFGLGNDIVQSIKIGSFLFLAEIFLSILKALLNNRLEFNAIASRSAFGKVFQFLTLSVFTVFLKVNLQVVVFSMVVASLLSTFTLLRKALKAWEPWRHIKASEDRVFFRMVRAHGKWASMKTWVSQSVSRIQPWIINFFLGTEAVGIYSIALSLADIFMSFASSKTLGTLVTSIFHDKNRAQRVFIYSAKYYVLLSLIGIIGAFIFVPPVVNLFFNKYIPSLNFFYALLLIVPVKAFWQMVDLNLVAFRKQKFVFFRVLSRNIAALIMLVILLPLAGLWGAVLTEIFITFALTFASYKYLVKNSSIFRLRFRNFISFTSEDSLIFKTMYNNLKYLLRIS